MASFADTALRTFESDLAPLFKGFSLATFAPVILIAFVAFFAFKLFFADSPYGQYSRSLGLTASNLWDHRNQLGLSPSIRGRSLASLEPLTEVLDAISNSIKKYESDSPNSFGKHNSKVRFE